MNQEQNKTQLSAKERQALKKQRWLKKRQWLQMRTSLLGLMIIVPVYALITLFLLVFPRSTISEIENRTLATFPKFTISSYFSGDFTADIATYYDDTVPFRDSFKRTGSQLLGVLGVAGSEDTITLIQTDIVADNMNPEEEESSSAEASVAEQVAAPEVSPVVSEDPDKDYTAEEAEFGMSNGLMVVQQDGHWKCLPLFGGGSDDNYVNALNTLQERVGDDVTIYSMPAPLSSEFYVPSNASDYSASQSDRFDAIAEKLDDGIVSINLCPVLAQHTEEEIYCRTDHHWQPLGAYYSCQEFASVAGVPFADLSEYEKGVNSGYVGTMYAYSQDSRILNDPEDFTYYVPQCDYDTYYYDASFNYLYENSLFIDVDVASSYLMFMGSDTFIVKINTAVKNGRTLMIVKDSYGNAMIPFFTSSFEQIIVTDMRYFNLNMVDFIEEMGVTDLLFSMCAYSVVGTNADNLMTLIEQNPGQEIVDEQAQEAQEAETGTSEPESSEIADPVADAETDTTSTAESTETAALPPDTPLGKDESST